MAYAVHIKLEELEKNTAELKKIIAAQAAQINRNTTTIHQLLGGLFNQRTQARILNIYMSGLFVEDGVSASEAAASEAAASEAAASEAAADDDDDEADASEAEDEELENVWPTTRQGDEHSERLKEMEERFRKLEEQVVAMEKRQLEKFGSTE